MSLCGRTVGDASRAAAVIGSWLLVTCCFTRPSSGLEAVTITPSTDGTAAGSQPAASAAQNGATVLRIVVAEDREPAPSPPAVVSHANVAPSENGESLRLQLQIGPSEQIAPPSQRDGASATPAAASPKLASGSSDDGDMLESLQAIPNAQNKNDSPTLHVPNATSATRIDRLPWTTSPAGDVNASAGLFPTAPVTPNDYSLSLPPRQLTPPEPYQLADRLAMTRLALKPANEDSENGESDETIPPPPATGEPAFQSASEPPAPAGEDTIAGAKKLGEEPVDNRLEFLRAETVLLEPGEWQWDVGLVYVFQHDDIPIALVDGVGDVTDVDEGRIRSRQLYVPLAARYGLNRRTQLFVNVPLGWANSELSFYGSDEFDHDGVIGDITVGSTFLVSSNECRDVTFTFAATAPTGGDPFDAALAFPAAALGDGFWALSGDLTCIRTYDPVVLFTSIGSRHYFERSFDGADILPGSEYRWSMGVGLAVSAKVTLSARFAASYIEETEINDSRVPGTIQEPMTVQLAATIAQCHRWFEPFVEFGTNEDANATAFGVIYTY